MWPAYDLKCRREVDALLKKGGSLSAYRASSAFPTWKGPRSGSEAWKLEMEIEKAFNVKHAIAVNSGTAALHAALATMPNIAGREVITTPYSFSATVSAILLAGGIPRFADIDQTTFCITKETVKRVITKKTAAILPVHLFGYFQDLSALKEFDLPIIEDACQAVGAVREGTYAGTSGIAGAYSFNGGKAVPSGEGGAVVTNDSRLAKKIRLFCNHGENFGSSVGYNYRMQELVALVARHGLLDLEERNKRRRALAYGLLGGGYPTVPSDFGWPFFRDPVIQFSLNSDASVYYVVAALLHKSINRDRFVKRLLKRGIGSQAGYTQPLHTLPAFRKYQTTPLPVVEEVHKKLCLLTTLTPDRPLSYAKRVAKAIRESLS